MRLRMESNIQAEARKYVAELQRIQAEARDLQASYRAGNVTAERYRQEMARLAAEHQNLNRAAREAGKAVDESSRSMRDGMGGFGRTMGQVGFIVASGFDDIRYGARAVSNNILQLVMVLSSRLNPIIGTLAMVAVPTLMAAFGKTIDRALAAAGILDENLAKGLERGKDSAEKMTTAVERLNDRLKGLPAAAKEAGDAIGKSFEDMGTGGQAELAQQLIKEGFGQGEIDTQKSRLANIEQFAERSGTRGARRAADEARNKLQQAYAARQAGAGREIEDLMAAAASGDQGARDRLSGLAGRAGQRQFAATVANGGMAPVYDSTVGPTRATMETGLAEQKRKEAEDQRLRDDAGRATKDAYKASVEAALGSIVGLDDRVDQGLKNRLRENMAAGMSGEEARATAGGAVAANLTQEILRGSPHMPEKVAAEAAAEVVRTRGRALREEAASEVLDPEGTEDRARRVAELTERMNKQDPTAAPAVFTAEGFNAQVQGAGAKTSEKHLEELKEKAEIQVQLTREMNRNLERLALTE